MNSTSRSGMILRDLAASFVPGRAVPSWHAVKTVITLLLLLLSIVLVFSGCEKETPSESPEEVVKKFYGYISEGSPSELNAAFALVDERDQLSRAKFTQIIKKYPPGFNVSVLDSKIEKEIAIVNIEYRMPSMFGGDYKVKNSISLTLDNDTNTWKVDFTGETYEEDTNQIRKNKAMQKKRL